MVGLNNVDNTSDKLKVVSDATQTALDLKSAKNAPTFTGKAAFSGGLEITGGTAAGITSAMVGLGNVDNTSDKLKVISDATNTALGVLTIGLATKEPVFSVVSPFFK